MLQQEQGGTWHDSAADHFIPIDQSLAASIQQPGRYRLAALQSPWSILYSTAADTRTPTLDGRYAASLLPDRGRTVELTLLSRGGGRGHVGFFLSETDDEVVLLGGNQSDAVSIQSYPKVRVLGHVWPT